MLFTLTITDFCFCTQKIQKEIQTEHINRKTIEDNTGLEQSITVHERGTLLVVLRHLDIN